MITDNLQIAVLPGDGIGSEVTAACLRLLDACATGLEFRQLEAGALCYRRTGESLPGEVMEACRSADAVLLGAMGLPEIRYADGTEISPQLDLRFELDLYAGVRPVRPLAGLPLPLANPAGRTIDFVLVRESTEGLFASRGRGVVREDREAEDFMLITRTGSERLFRFAFELAAERAADERPGELTCVDKANVFRSMAFFRRIFDEVADAHPAVTARHMYVDAAALNMVRAPWDLDVMVTENMFGDILSDLGAGLMGGMGMAPSADVGDRHAVFQPCHGSAPDIAGQGIANPVAMILSAAMMLRWLSRQHHRPDLEAAAGRLEAAVDGAMAIPDNLPAELGGTAGTDKITDAILAELLR
jgi:3-isopropylmalate dehydrogenase